MKFISIDSTSEIIQFCCYDSDEKSFIKIQNAGIKKSSEEIIFLFKKLLQESKTDLSNIYAFVCITGPGSFTGIRLGLSFVSGLTSGIKVTNPNIKTIPLTLFQTHLYSHDFKSIKSDKISIILKSNNPEKVFTQCFANKTLQALSIPTEDLKSQQIQNTNAIITGDAGYDMENVLKYVADNIEKFQTVDNIVPCYIRPHYGTPKQYIITEDTSKNLKKIFISNEEKILGFIEYQATNTTSEITDFQIEKAYRRMGIGTLLLQKFIDKMQSKSCEKIMLDVRSKNESALNLYKKFAFCQDGIRKNYYTTNEPDDALLISLVLKNPK